MSLWCANGPPFLVVGRVTFHNNKIVPLVIFIAIRIQKTTWGNLANVDGSHEARVMLNPYSAICYYFLPLGWILVV